MSSSLYFLRNNTINYHIIQNDRILLEAKKLYVRDPLDSFFISLMSQKDFLELLHLPFSLIAWIQGNPENFTYLKPHCRTQRRRQLPLHRALSEVWNSHAVWYSADNCPLWVFFSVVCQILALPTQDKRKKVFFIFQHILTILFHQYIGTYQAFSTMSIR